MKEIAQKIIICCLALLLGASSLFAEERVEQPATVSDDSGVCDETLAKTPREKSFGKAMIGMGIVLVPGIVWYYSSNSNKRDQLFNLSAKDQKRRYTTFQDWRFDDNVFETNAVSHSLAGSLYFLSGRVNGFNQWQSFLFALGGSLFWEYVVELKEVISINDMIHTPIGGYSIGESLFQVMSFYAANSSENWFSNLASYMTDNEKYRYCGGISKNGSLPSIYHNIYAFAGLLLNDYYQVNAKAGFDAELFAVRRLKQYGRINGFYFDTPYSRITTQIGIGIKGLDESWFYAETGLIGYALQNIRVTDGNRKGYSIYLGLHSALDYTMRHFDAYHDKQGIVHILGNAADLSFVNNNFTFRMKNTIFWDFAMIDSIGLRAYYSNGHIPDDVRAQGQSTAAEKGYYYAWGFTDTVSLTADIYRVQVGVDFSFGKYWSINTDGRTNRDPKTHCNFRMQDTRMAVKSYIQYNTNSFMAYRFGGYFAYMEGSAERISKSAYGKKFELSAIFRVR